MKRTLAEANALAVKYMPLAIAAATRLKTILPSTVETDDLVGAGYLGLVKASHAYDPSRGATFGGYARIRVRGEILDWLRVNDWLPKGKRAQLAEAGTHVPLMLSLEARLVSDGQDGEIVTGRHILEARQAPPGHAVDIADFWEAGWPWVSERDWRILEMHYRDGMTQKQIACICGLSEAYVSFLVKRIRLRAAS